MQIENLKQAKREETLAFGDEKQEKENRITELKEQMELKRKKRFEIEVLLEDMDTEIKDKLQKIEQARMKKAE